MAVLQGLENAREFQPVFLWTSNSHISTYPGAIACLFQLMILVTRKLTCLELPIWQVSVKVTCPG